MPLIERHFLSSIVYQRGLREPVPGLPAPPAGLAAALKAGLPLAALAATLMLAGCNTIRGMGQDVQSAGNAIERAAR